MVGAMVIAGLAFSAVSASAYGPYTTGSIGYDVSYPNCGATPSGAFAIVGVNGGRPFSNNSCFQTEYMAAPQSPVPSLYINTGYSGAYRRHITASCSSQSKPVAGGSALQQAWAIGCSEAETSLNYAQEPAAMWWLDVETGNSWSSGNVSLNRATIQGAVSRLLAANPEVGVYSTASMWTTITGGGWSPTNVAGDWVAGAACATATAFMPNTTVWLTQSTSGGVDYDTVC